MATTTKRFYGTSIVELGAIASDGGLSAAFAGIGDTVIDSVIVSKTEGTTNPVYIEESDAPIEFLNGTPGVYTIKWSTYNTDPANLAKFLGGTVSTNVWTAPTVELDVELSIKITDKRSNIISATRVKITSAMSLALKKSGIGQIDLTATVLTPTKAGEPTMTITKIAA